MPTVYIGIGANLGEKRANCLRALELLKGRGIEITKVSSMHETEPWGVTDQPKFINMAIEIETGLAPLPLLQLLKGIEKDMGRMEGPKWGSRIIDLDILLYDDLVLSDPGLSIPHPLMHRRVFVLKPLSEIAAGKKHPLLLKTIGALLSEVDS